MTTYHARRASLVPVVLALALTGCQSVPGSREEQATGVGAATGAALGAAARDEDSLEGALLGGALGAAGGYLVGARTDWFDQSSDYRGEESRRAVERAVEDPATPAEVYAADTADLNDDGFVTLDELVAMEEAGLSDREMIRRLEATDQVFELSAEQEQRLRQAGLSDTVIAAIGGINEDQRDVILGRAAS